MPWLHVVACAIIFLGLLVILYPSVSSWFHQLEQSRVILDQLAKESTRQHDFADPLEQAYEYNDALNSGALYAPGTNIATANSNISQEEYEYEEILAMGVDGYMARLYYEDLKIDLPIYHGTSSKVLEKGVGHLEGTSLPVGGVGTRSVLTAHRGLPTATLFDNLVDGAVGDIFTIGVLDQALTYKVVDVKVIEPDDTEEILPHPDQDLVTLITCTPLGVNTHRVLVTGERVLPTPEKEIEAIADSPKIPAFPWWVVILSLTLLVIGIYIWRTGFRLGEDRKDSTRDNAKVEQFSSYG